MTLPEFRRRLLTWYKTHHRDLPWRQSNDPYPIWISEVMLQQTQVETVIPYFQRFIERFPTVQKLAKADLSVVLKVWEGMGYYARARNLHKAARIVMEQHVGKIPLTCQDLKRLPGIGDYTAAAIASIAFGEPVAVLDGNVKRVVARWKGVFDDLRLPKTVKALQEEASHYLDNKHSGDWNQAVMELGATVCLPRQPLCNKCPVKVGCYAYKSDKTDIIPFVSKRKPIPHYDVTAGLIWDSGKLLITQRKEEGMLGGLWEFPGGKQEPGETLEECLNRELEEELTISVEVGQKVYAVKHAYTHFKITLHVFHCVIISGKPKAIGCQQWRWIEPMQLDEFAFPKADRSIIDSIIKNAKLRQVK